MAYFSTIISGAASLGVLIGLISGIFFLVLSGLKWVGRVRATLYEEELRRQKRLLLDNPYLTGNRSPNLIETRKEDNGFASAYCGSAFEDTPEKDTQSDTEATVDWSVRKSQDGEIAGKQNTVNTDTILVREFIEKLVETIIGGPLDGITVGKLSTHPAYENANGPDLPNSHSSLKRLIKQIVSEAMALPNIKEILCRPNATGSDVNDDFNNKSYEDILATAILNKVIENFQKRDIVIKEKARSNSDKFIRREDDEDLMSHSDWSDTSRSDQLSLTIEEHIEEVTTAFEISDDERCELSSFETTINRRIPFPESGRIVKEGTDDENSDPEEKNSATELITSTNSWEDNWLFQRKRLRSTPNAHHPVPVPMLVPNPSEDFRALVGGVDADDLSDMSDCSDSVLEELITTEENPIANVSNPESKPLSHDTEATELEMPRKDESVTETKTDEAVEESLEGKKAKDLGSGMVEARESELACVGEAEEESNGEANSGDGKTVSQVSTSPEVLSQKDREFAVEDFDLVHQYEAAAASQTPSQGDAFSPANNGNEERLRCRIAEREKEKWRNPVPLPDNPYSLENIEKRERRNKNAFFRIGTYTRDYTDFPDDLSSDEYDRKKDENLRFTRDYYVNSSKQPSGMSSPSSLTQISEGKEQDVTSAESKSASEFCNEFTFRENQDNRTVMSGSHMIVKNKITLPNVKELAKHFAPEDVKGSDRSNATLVPSAHSGTQLQSKHKPRNLSKSLNFHDEREPEIDYSTIPVPQIILNLTKASSPPARKGNREHKLFNHVSPNQMEICRKADNNLPLQNHAEKICKKSDEIEAVRFNGKQVHSLTARSISKEFREGLKNNNSYQKVFPKIDRSSSGGESDFGEVVCGKGNVSPTPSIDLKNMKKFWEEMITANCTK